MGRRTPYILGAAAVAAMIFGALQNILYTYTDIDFVNNLDDMIVIFAFVLSIGRWGRISQPVLFGLGTWMIFLVLALIRSLDEGQTSVSEGIFLFRQVAMPAVVIAIGVVLTSSEWRRIAKFTVFLGVLSAIYCFYEELIGRPVDPAIMSRRDGMYIYPSGLPGNYLGFWLDGSQMIRAGGPFLNPPTAGVLLAVAAVISFHSYSGRRRLLLLAMLVPATLLTVSRAGMLVGIIGIVLPWAAKRISGYLVLPVMVIAAIPFAQSLMTQGGTGSHMNGLVVGFTDGMSHFFGRGFGFVGNFTANVATEKAGESLAGIAFSAAGVPIIVLYSLVMLTLLRKTIKTPGDWVTSLALGALLAALFAETAGSMNATVPLWLAAGYSLGPSINTNFRTSPSKKVSIHEAV